MSETRKDTKPLCGFQDRCSPSEPYCGQTPCAYHEAVVREAEQTLRDHAPHLLAAATPPTPDRAAVREAVIELLGYARSPQIARLSESLGLGRYVGKGTERHRVCHRIAYTLLAAVSRPAEARGEPVAWCPRLVDGRLQIEHATADKAECEEEVRMLNLVPNASSDPRWQPVSVQPLYAHPAPSGGEAVRCTNPHNDTSDPNHHCWHARETCCHCETSRDAIAASRPAVPADGTECANCRGGVVVAELPDSALDAAGICGYCRRMGIGPHHLADASKTLPAGEPSEARDA